MFRVFEPPAHVQFLLPVGHVQTFVILSLPTENYT